MKRRILFSVCLAGVLSLAWLSSDASAATRYVLPGSSIQSAIDAAQPGDVIIVRSGNYTGTGNRNISFKGKAIIVRSEAGKESCIIDCGGSSSNEARCFNFSSGETTSAVLDGFTLTGGSTKTNGGGIAISSSPTIQNCRIIGNSTKGPGGGIFCQGGSPLILNCIISDNSADGPYGGGGIALYQSSAIISGNTIQFNTAAEDGGGIYAIDGAPKITNNTIIGNMSLGPWGGGGICSWSAGSVIVNDVIVQNLAQMFGGGLYVRNSPAPIITSCTFTENGLNMTGPDGARGREVLIYNVRADVVNSIIWRNDKTIAAWRFVPPASAPCAATFQPIQPEADDVFDIVAQNNSVVRMSYCIMTKYISGVIVGGELAETGSSITVSYIKQDPLFAAPGRFDTTDGLSCDPNSYDWLPGTDWHLKSEYGRVVSLDPFTTEVDGQTSPGVDRGSVISDYSREPYPNGGRINIGAYGGTPGASLSAARFDGAVLSIDGPAASVPRSEGSGGSFQITISGEKLGAVGAIQAAVKFYSMNVVQSNAYDYLSVAGFQISETGGNPDFDGQAIYQDPTLFPPGEGSIFPVYSADHQLFGLVSLSTPPDKTVDAETLLFTVTYDFAATVPSGTYLIEIDANKSMLASATGNVPFETVFGTVTIDQPVPISRWGAPGDANGDCTVNILDMMFVRDRLNMDVNSGNNWQADVNEDGNINILDLIFVRDKLNTVCPP